MMSLSKPRDFDAIRKLLIKQKKDFIIVERGRKKTVIISGQPRIYYNSISHNNSKYFKDATKLNLIRIVHAQVNKHIKSKGFLIDEVPHVFSSINIKKALYSTYPDGYCFYHVDIKHAYWRFAYLLGYITYATYTKYKDDPDYKLARNIALSTLSTKKKRKYYSQGKFINQILSYDICSWTIYKNIRYSTYNICGEINKMLGDKCLAYRVDGVIILGEALSIVKEFMRINKLYFKVIECQKANDFQYVITDSGELKNL